MDYFEIGLSLATQGVYNDPPHDITRAANERDVLYAIAVQQGIQMRNKPTSTAWEEAHQEIYRLADLLTGKPCLDAIGRRTR